MSFRQQALTGSDGTQTVTGVEFVNFSDARYAVADLLSLRRTGRWSRPTTPRARRARAGRRRGARQRHGRRRGRTCMYVVALGMACARTRTRRRIRPSPDSTATTASPTRCPTDEAVPIRRASRSQCSYFFRRRASELYRRGTQGSWIKVTVNRFEGGLDSAAAARARERCAAGRPSRKIITAWPR